MDPISDPGVSCAQKQLLYSGNTPFLLPTGSLPKMEGELCNRFPCSCWQPQPHLRNHLLRFVTLSLCEPQAAQWCDVRLGATSEETLGVSERSQDHTYHSVGHSTERGRRLHKGSIQPAGRDTNLRGKRVTVRLDSALKHTHTKPDA